MKIQFDSCPIVLRITRFVVSTKAYTNGLSIRVCRVRGQAVEGEDEVLEIDIVFNSGHYSNGWVEEWQPYI